jgi:hypothetical protein
MSSGFLDTDAASGYVSSTFADATNKASSAFSSSMTLINQLADLPDIDAPSITAPTAPATPELTNQPEAPTINTPHLGTISIDDAPVLDSLDLPDVVIPDFTATAPTISISDKPELDEPEAPGTTPSWEDISLPGEPDIILPTVPTLDPVDIPNFDIFIRTSFEGDRPAAPTFEAPGRLYLYQEGEFSSDLQDAIEQQIYDGLLAGGDIKAIAGIAAYIEQVRSEAARTLRVEQAAIRDGWAARGLDGPTGADLDKEQQARWRYADTINERVAQVSGKQCELTLQHFEFLITNGISAVGMRLDTYHKVQQRALDSARATAEFGYKCVEMQIGVYNLQLARYQADVALFEAKSRAASEVLEEQRLYLQRAQLAAELRKQAIDEYVARCQALNVTVEVFKTRIQAALAKITAQNEKIAAIRATVDVYVAKMNAMVARYNVWGQEIAANKTRVDLYQAQAGAFATQVSAQKVVADIGATKANIVDARNKGNIALYQAQLDGAKTQLARMTAEVDAAIKTATTQIQLYDAQTRGVAAENEAKRGLSALQVQEWATNLNSLVEQARLSLQYAQTMADLAQKAQIAAAQTASQLAASALGSRHASASVGFSGSNSNSNSFNTSYNYSSSQSASV